MQHIKKKNQNNKVLLRERKRHTARPVASARYARGGGGIPFSHDGGVPHPVMVGGTPPPSRPGPGVGDGGGTMGTPHHPDLGWGTPPTQTWDGVTPPPPPMVKQTDIPKYKYYLPSYNARGR